MPGNFIQFDQMPTAGRNKSTEQQVAELRNYIKGVMDQLRYELRRIGNTETSGRGNTGGNGSRADTFGYPVGSIYISTISTNPTELFGGVWVRLQDRFLLAAGETYEAGETGGEATHTLTTDEMPAHYGHLYNNAAHSMPDAGEDTYYLNSATQGKFGTTRPYVVRNGNELAMRGFTRGAGAAHNNMPPYLAVYMWQRTA